MGPDLREERLQVTEMRWYLLPLMTGPATNRAAQLASDPGRIRQAVENPLAGMGQAAGGRAKGAVRQRSQFLISPRSKTSRRAAAKNLKTSRPPAARNCRQGIEQWNSCPRTSAGKYSARFNQFFDLTAEEKEKALRTLSGPERRQIEKTLQTYRSLPPDQRAECVRAFENSPVSAWKSGSSF